VGGLTLRSGAGSPFATKQAGRSKSTVMLARPSDGRILSVDVNESFAGVISRITASSGGLGIPEFDLLDGALVESGGGCNMYTKFAKFPNEDSALFNTVKVKIIGSLSCADVLGLGVLIPL
jgi:hypothetical protein